ncbi:EF-hand domain-containing protein [Ferrigenium sp. UT5]|uniref:EF-hand domain-containing protein n=1 Tax=Ferrigenium sp. UT5 TaxID=3242105 RepID=UPI00354ED679
MKTFPLWVVAGSLFCLAPLASACPDGHHGAHPGMGMSEMDANSDGILDQKEFAAFHEQRFQQLDANHDGKISRDELPGMQGCDRKKAGQRFEDRFDATDINHDGVLSKEEAEIGMPMLFAHFDEIDANKDGKLGKDEVTASMKKLHEQGGAGMRRKE